VTTVVAPHVRERTRTKARVLLDALPYMAEHSGHVVVVKLGGAAMEDPALADRFAEDVALLRLVGVRPIIVHGGGPQVSALSERLGLAPRFEGGHRVTDADTLQVAKMVLVGKINKDVVAALNRRGVPAVGLSGEDGNLLLAEKRRAANGPDLGFVGDIGAVNVALLDHLLPVAVPVIASIATDGRGQSYNVNADLAAAAIAARTHAAKVFLLTDVPGAMRDGELISELTVDEAERLMASEAVSGGMLPKLEAILQALRAGVPRAHIVDGRIEHVLILELFTPEGMGTMVTHPGPADAPAEAEAEAEAVP